jgi:hypothetical protein
VIWSSKFPRPTNETHPPFTGTNKYEQAQKRFHIFSIFSLFSTETSDGTEDNSYRFTVYSYLGTISVLFKTRKSCAVVTSKEPTGSSRYVVHHFHPELTDDNTTVLVQRKGSTVPKSSGVGRNQQKRQDWCQGMRFQVHITNQFLSASCQTDDSRFLTSDNRGMRCSQPTVPGFRRASGQCLKRANHSRKSNATANKHSALG